MAKTKPSVLPGADDEPAAEITRRVADNLRRLRKEYALSLDKLAASSGVSRAALSQIEGMKTNPTLGVLWKIAVGLGVPFQTLLDAPRGGRAQVMRAADCLAVRSANGRAECRLLSPPGSPGSAETYELRFRKGGFIASDAHIDGTTETVVAIAGKLRVSLAQEHYDLAPGDTIFFAADVPHRYENRGSGEARCLDIIAYGRGA